MSHLWQRVETALYRRAPARFRRPLRWLLYAPLDLLGWLRGRQNGDELLPPARLRDIGAGDFRSVGESFVTLLRTHCGLEPRHRVLDLGCGIGRMGIPLARFLRRAEGGRYDGIDVSRRDIRWCQRHVTPRYPHARFHHADVHNGMYASGRDTRADDYRFPFADSSFDVALAASLFTHLLVDDTRHYLHELARVLDDDGHALLTFFVLDDEAKERISNGECGLTFAHRRGDAFVHDTARPEGAVAYEPEWLRDACADAGLEIDIHPGTWSGRVEGLSFQDVVLTRLIRSKSSSLNRQSSA
ncbi:MAG: class I SAM-dependent methyltransferase [Acidobacteriota bacterium]